MKIPRFCFAAKLGLMATLLILPGSASADDISNGSYRTLDGANNAAPPNGFPAGMFPNQLEPTNRSVMGATKRWWERANPNLTTTGSAGAYIYTPSNTGFPTALTQGEVYCAKANFTSVGNDTLNINGLGALPIYAQGLSSIGKIAASTILAGAQFCVGFDAVLNSGAGGFQLLSTALPAGLGTAAFQPSTAFLATSSNLSDVPNKGTARVSLGDGTHNVPVVTASTSPPSGSGTNVGDLWIQY